LALGALQDIGPAASRFADHRAKRQAPSAKRREEERRAMTGNAFRSARWATVFILLLGGLGVATLDGSVRAADWPQWRGPSRNGVTSEEGCLTAWPASGPPRLWSAQIGKSYAAVSVQGKRLYTMGAKDGKETLFCFDAVSGAVRWRYTQAHPNRETQYDPNPTASTATPVVAGERVYALTREGLALCLSAKDGKLLWRRDLARETQGGLPPFGCASSPLIEGDRVIYNVGKHGIALRKQTGAVIWNSGPGVAGHASAVLYRIGGQRVVLMFTGGGLVGVDLLTGRPLWRQAWTSPNNLYAVDPIVSGERIFITGYGRAEQLQLAGDTLSVVYETRSLRSSFSNPVLLGGYLYGSDRGTLQCVEWATGALKWSQPTVLLGPPGQEAGGARHHPLGEGALIAAGKHLMALDEAGNLHLVAATPEAYRELAHARVMDGPCWTAPVLANGLLYCRNIDGNLVCLDVRSRQST
jgi:outer membrane protein assembly factor BamB